MGPKVYIETSTNGKQRFVLKRHHSHHHHDHRHDDYFDIPENHHYRRLHDHYCHEPYADVTQAEYDLLLERERYYREFNDKLRREKDVVKAELQKANYDITEYRGRIQSYESHVSQLSADNAALRREIEELGRAHDDDAEKCRGWRNQVTLLKNQNAALSEENQSLQKQVRTGAERLAKSQDHVCQLEDKVNRLTTSLREWKEKCHYLEEKVRYYESAPYRRDHYRC